MPLANNTRNLTKQNKARTRKLRREMTASERKLWSFLRNRQMGFLFRTQYAVGDFSLDFYCPEVKVCIEVDGPHHEGRVEEDEARDEHLQGKGILTIRIPSCDLFERDYPLLGKWLDTIEKICLERRRASKLPGTSTPGPCEAQTELSS